MTNYKIEDGIEIPKVRVGGRPTIYPWRDLEVGQSFFVPCDDKVARKRKMSSIVAQARNARTDIRLATRTVTEDGVIGLRAWRIE